MTANWFLVRTLAAALLQREPLSRLHDYLLGIARCNGPPTSGEFVDLVRHGYRCALDYRMGTPDSGADAIVLACQGMDAESLLALVLTGAPSVGKSAVSPGVERTEPPLLALAAQALRCGIRYRAVETRKSIAKETQIILETLQAMRICLQADCRNVAGIVVQGVPCVSFGGEKARTGFSVVDMHRFGGVALAWSESSMHSSTIDSGFTSAGVVQALGGSILPYCSAAYFHVGPSGAEGASEAACLTSKQRNRVIQQVRPHIAQDVFGMYLAQQLPCDLRSQIPTGMDQCGFGAGFFNVQLMCALAARASTSTAHALVSVLSKLPNGHRHFVRLACAAAQHANMAALPVLLTAVRERTVVENDFADAERESIEIRSTNRMDVDLASMLHRQRQLTQARLEIASKKRNSISANTNGIEAVDCISKFFAATRELLTLDAQITRLVELDPVLPPSSAASGNSQHTPVHHQTARSATSTIPMKNTTASPNSRDEMECRLVNFPVGADGRYSNSTLRRLLVPLFLAACKAAVWTDSEREQGIVDEASFTAFYQRLHAAPIATCASIAKELVVGLEAYQKLASKGLPPLCLDEFKWDDVFLLHLEAYVENRSVRIWYEWLSSFQYISGNCGRAVMSWEARLQELLLVVPVLAEPPNPNRRVRLTREERRALRQQSPGTEAG